MATPSTAMATLGGVAHGPPHKSRSVISKGTTHELFRMQDDFKEIV